MSVSRPWLGAWKQVFLKFESLNPKNSENIVDFQSKLATMNCEEGLCSSFQCAVKRDSQVSNDCCHQTSQDWSQVLFRAISRCDNFKYRMKSLLCRVIWLTLPWRWEIVLVSAQYWHSGGSEILRKLLVNWHKYLLR